MKKVKTMLLSLALCLCLCLGLAGCGGTPTPGASYDPDLDVDPDITATLNIAILNTNEERNIMQELTTGFKTMYPNVSFTFTQLTTYETGIIQAIQEGLMLDVLWVPDAYVTSMADSNLLLDLTEYIEAEAASSASDKFDVNDYYPSMIKLGQYKHGSDPENQDQYFLPRDYSKIVTYVNTALLGQYAPEFDFDYYRENMDEWTWDVFVDLCKTLKAGMDAVSDNRICIESDWSWLIQFYGMMLSYGGTYLNENGEVVMDEGFQETLRSVKTLIDAGYTDYTGAGSLTQYFHGGNAVMCFQPRPYLATASVLRDDLDVLPFPAITENEAGEELTPYVGTGTTGYGICSYSENPNLAWQFLKYMMSADGQTVLSNTGSVVPAMISLREGTDGVEPGWRLFRQEYNYNHDAFVFGEERDVVQSYYDMLTSSEAERHNNALLNLFNHYYPLNSNRTLEDVIAEYKESVR